VKSNSFGRTRAISSGVTTEVNQHP
jgi:hypothetical protein